MTDPKQNEPYIDWVVQTLNANERLKQIPSLWQNGSLKLYPLGAPKNETLPLIWFTTLSIGDKDTRTLADFKNLAYEAEMQFNVMTGSFNFTRELANIIYGEFDSKVRPYERVITAYCDKPIFSKSESESDAQEVIYEAAVRATITFTR